MPLSPASGVRDQAVFRHSLAPPHVCVLHGVGAAVGAWSLVWFPSSSPTAACSNILFTPSHLREEGAETSFRPLLALAKEDEI